MTSGGKWILPSRGRPDNLARFVDRYRLHRSCTRVDVIVDECDLMRDDYIRMARDWPQAIELHVMLRQPLGEIQNRWYGHNPDLAWYGMLGDDAVPATDEWDRLLVEAAGRDGVAYCADGVNDERQASQSVIGGDLVREMGWLILPGLERIYGDNVWTDIARERGTLRYLPHVRLEHWHFSNGKAPYDETYRKPCADSDERIYLRWRAQFNAQRAAA
jgi:hypothetical protein